MRAHIQKDEGRNSRRAQTGRVDRYLARLMTCNVCWAFATLDVPGQLVLPVLAIKYGTVQLVFCWGTLCTYTLVEVVGCKAYLVVVVVVTVMTFFVCDQDK